MADKKNAEEILAGKQAVADAYTGTTQDKGNWTYTDDEGKTYYYADADEAPAGVTLTQYRESGKKKGEYITTKTTKVSNGTKRAEASNLQAIAQKKAEQKKEIKTAPKVKKTNEDGTKKTNLEIATEYQGTSQAKGKYTYTDENGVAHFYEKANDAPEGVKVTAYTTNKTTGNVVLDNKDTAVSTGGSRYKTAKNASMTDKEKAEYNEIVTNSNDPDYQARSNAQAENEKRQGVKSTAEVGTWEEINAKKEELDAEDARKLKEAQDKYDRDRLQAKYGKKEEAPVVKENLTTNPSDYIKKEEIVEEEPAEETVEETPEEKTVEEVPAEEKKKLTPFQKFWNNMIYGNDYGSTRDKMSAEDKAKKVAEFMDKNPSLIKGIFGNSGKNFGERAALLGELLGSTTADIAGSIYAGRHGQSLPEATVGKYGQIFNNAIKEQERRRQELKDAEQEAKKIKASNRSIIDSNPILKNLSESARDTMAEYLVRGMSEDEMKALLSNEPEAITPEQFNQIYNSFNNEKINNASITSQKSNALDVTGKEIENQQKGLDLAKNQIMLSMDTAEKVNQQVEEIDKLLRTLEEQKITNTDISQDQYFKCINGFLDYKKGVVSVSENTNDTDSSTNSTSSEKHGEGHVNTSVSGGGNIGVVKVNASVDVGGSWGNSDTTAEQKAKTRQKGESASSDALVLEAIPHAEAAAKDWSNNRDIAVQEYNRAIDAQIAYWKKTRAELIARGEKLKAKADAQIEDGIVKAPKMKQWLVREDGTRIQLHPDDSIYATKKILTTKKDDGKEVVPMTKEDECVVIQKKLGHKGGKICKDFSSYLAKLK